MAGKTGGDGRRRGSLETKCGNETMPASSTLFDTQGRAVFFHVASALRLESYMSLTIGDVVEVHVGVAQGAPGDGVATHPNGRDRPDLQRQK